MNTKLLITILNLFCISLSFANDVTIHIKTTHAKIQEVEAFYVDLDKKNIFTMAKIDPNGEALLRFDMKHPYFVLINFGDSNQSLYVKPNEAYEVSVDFTKKYLDVQFAGKDAGINNYLEQAKEIFFEYRYNKKGYYEWSIDELSKGIKKIDSILTTERNAFFLTNHISVQDKGLLENLAKSDILAYKMAHFLAKFNPTTTETTPPVILQNLEKSVPFDEVLLETHPESYQMILKFYYMILTQRKQKKFSIDAQTLTEEFYLEFCYDDIEQYSIPPKFKELMLTQLQMYCLMRKVPENFNEFFDKFKNQFPDSEYLSKIIKQCTSLQKISNGNKAFEIIGKTIDGNLIKLSDFTGKLVYIDFWATWCSTCIKEMPASIKLQEKFKDSKDLVFLFVSIDNDHDKWKNYLKKHTDLTGVQINITEETSNETRKNYFINSVPRYMIIGKDGKIIDSSAERPSSDKIEQQLISLLKIL